MVRNDRSSDQDKIETLVNATKNDKGRLDELCKEFDVMNPKSHDGKFVE